MGKKKMGHREWGDIAKALGNISQASNNEKHQEQYRRGQDDEKSWLQLFNKILPLPVAAVLEAHLERSQWKEPLSSPMTRAIQQNE